MHVHNSLLRIHLSPSFWAHWLFYQFNLTSGVRVRSVRSLSIARRNPKCQASHTIWGLDENEMRENTTYTHTNSYTLSTTTTKMISFMNKITLRLLDVCTFKLIHMLWLNISYARWCWKKTTTLWRQMNGHLPLYSTSCHIRDSETLSNNRCYNLQCAHIFSQRICDGISKANILTNTHTHTRTCNTKWNSCTMCIFLFLTS